MTTFQNLPFTIRILLGEAAEQQNQSAITLHRCVVSLLSMASDQAIADACNVSESLVAMIRDAHDQCRMVGKEVTV
jgi:hypothetical protein